jgi:hypothetical protein
MQDPQIFQHARAHISSITTHIQDNKNTNLKFLTSMNPPAIGNMVVTSPILCIKAQTENPNHYIDIRNFLSKKNTEHSPTMLKPIRAPSGPERYKAYPNP